MHFACYQDDELFIGGRPADPSRADVTVELSDWHMSTRQQRKAAALTAVLVRLINAEPGSVNIRFHSHPPTDFAVGGRLLSDRIPAAGRFAIRLFG